MRVLIVSNSYNGPAVVTVFINGSPTSLSAHIPAGSTSDIDIPGTVTILDGDAISVLMDVRSVSAGLIYLTVSYEVK
jgi:hypothetical protein